MNEENWRNRAVVNSNENDRSSLDEKEESSSQNARETTSAESGGDKQQTSKSSSTGAVGENTNKSLFLSI